MRNRCVLMALAIVVMALAACGGGDEPDPTTDRATARQANLKAADFPSGWRSRPQENVAAEKKLAAEIARCLGVPAPATRATAEAHSPNFSSGLATQASSVIIFVESEEQAAEDAAAFAGDKFPACAQPGYAKQVQASAPEGATVEDVRISKASFPRYGDRTVAYRLNASIRVGEITVPLSIDQVRIYKDRAEVALTFINPGSPFPEDLARSLAAKVVERL